MGNFHDVWESLNCFAQACIALCIAGLMIGTVALIWVDVLGPRFNQADYNQFNNSPQHVGAVAQQFSRDCLQLAGEKDPITKKAIEQDIYQAASTVDVSMVDMPAATRTCVNQAVNNVTSGK